jgi:hypothetical protein
MSPMKPEKKIDSCYILDVFTHLHKMFENYVKKKYIISEPKFIQTTYDALEQVQK